MKLFSAIESGNLQAAKSLIENGADVNARNIFPDETPLHLVSKGGHTAIAELLIANGADIYKKMLIFLIFKMIILLM